MFCSFKPEKLEDKIGLADRRLVMLQDELRVVHDKLDQLRKTVTVLTESHEVFTHRLRDFFDHVERKTR